MSHIIKSRLPHQTTKTQAPNAQISKAASRNGMSAGLILTLTALSLAATGCSTTQEFKPTASVIVGAHKSL